MQLSKLIVLATFLVFAGLAEGRRGGADQGNDKDDKKPHHHHHHKKHQAAAVSASVKVRHAVELSAAKEASNQSGKVQASEIEQKISQIESQVVNDASSAEGLSRGTIAVSMPLPPDFAQRFSQAAAESVGVSPSAIKVISENPSQEGVADVEYEAPTGAVSALQHQAGDPDSKFAHSSMRSFLMAKDGDDAASAGAAGTSPTVNKLEVTMPSKASAVSEPCDHGDAAATYSRSSQGDPASIDIDTMMPYGELEPFGREDTAQELTERSVKESDEMVDQLERAEVAEEKRAVFRALTRLRGAAITSFDGVARSQTGNIDEYNKVHHWRSAHPLHHLADEEADISKWAFPDNAD